MIVKLKYRMYANGVVYEQGVQEIPDGTALPSTAEVLSEKPAPVPEPEPEPDTLSALQKKQIAVPK